MAETKDSEMAETKIQHDNIKIQNITSKAGVLFSDNHKTRPAVVFAESIALEGSYNTRRPLK